MDKIQQDLNAKAKDWKLNDLKDLLSRNGYPRGVITYNMNDVVNRNRNKPKDPITTVPKRDVFIVLPYLGLQSKFITDKAA